MGVPWVSVSMRDMTVRTVPAKSHFEQVHRVSEFGGLNLVKTPFFIRVVAARAGTIWILRTQPASVVNGPFAISIHSVRSRAARRISARL
jgi:hypothetical protein